MLLIHRHKMEEEDEKNIFYGTLRTISTLFAQGSREREKIVNSGQKCFCICHHSFNEKSDIKIVLGAT